MLRAAALAALALGAGAGAAASAPLPVVVVHGLQPAELARLEGRGAVGLLVPGAGRTTSAELAVAGLERGVVPNGARHAPSGPILVPVRYAAAVPSGPAIVLALPRGGRQPNDRRYPIAVLGAGYRGLLTSRSTRLPGLVSIDDVAPTARREDGRLGWRSQAGAAAAVAALDRRIDRHRRAKVPGMLLVCGLAGMLALALPRAGLLALPAALVANVVLGAAGATDLAVVLPALALAVGVGAPLLAVLFRRPVALACGVAGPLAVYAGAFLVDDGWVALSPLGPSQNGRYFGLSNLLGTMLLVPALGGAALASRWARGWGAVPVAALAFVTVAGSRFGADGGGAIVLAVGYAALAVGLARSPRRAGAVVAPAAAALVVALVGIDAATGASTHVTRALEEGPWSLAGDLADRAELSYRNAVATSGTVAAVVAGLLGLVASAWLVVRTASPLARASGLAALAALAASLVVNDSPVDVVVAGLAVVLGLARGLDYDFMNDGGSSTSWRMLPVRRG